MHGWKRELIQYLVAVLPKSTNGPSPYASLEISNGSLLHEKWRYATAAVWPAIASAALRVDVQFGAATDVPRPRVVQCFSMIAVRLSANGCRS